MCVASSVDVIRDVLGNARFSSVQTPNINLPTNSTTTTTTTTTTGDRGSTVVKVLCYKSEGR